MLCIAHRGYSLKYKDNSIIAIREAIARNYDGIEVDVQQCKTGELVMYHDIYIGTDFVEDLTIDELFSKGVHSLYALYEIVPEIESTMLFIDIKGSSTTICDELDTFYKKRSIRDVYFCSFNRPILYDLPKHFKKGSIFATTFIESEYAVITKDIQVVIIHWTCLNYIFIQYCKLNKITVFAYTHTCDKEMEYMIKYEIDGIITNGFLENRESEHLQ